MPDQIYKVSWNGQEKINYTYDGLGRLTNKSVLVGGGVPDAPKLNNIYTYQDVGTDKTTTLVQSVQTAAGTYTYTYDAVGNILTASDGTYTNSYVYDSLNQLVRENNQRFGKTYTYAYTNGNITERKEYAYTTGELGAPQYVYNWSYCDGTWSDLLTAWNESTASTANASSASAFSLQNTATSDETAQSFFKRALQRSSANSNVSRAARTASTASAESTTDTTQTIFYDEIGNPTEIFGLQFSWNGRQLTEITLPDDPYYSHIAYAYNMDGQRISKTLTAPDGTATTTEYFYNGSILAGEQTGDRTVVYMYDNNGDIFGFTVNGRTYYYVKNAQNDVTAITDSNGTVVVYYYYDAWGEPNYTYYACNGQTLDDVQYNPILYRSYYLDRETGFYYLNTRYYVPMFCRFLNGDAFTQTGQGMLDKNMFAYCGNNPVNRTDSNGNSWSDIKKWFCDKWNAVKSWANNTFGVSGEEVFQITEQETFIPDVLPITQKTGVTEKSVNQRTGQSSKSVTASYSHVINDPMRSTASVKIQLNSFDLKLTVGLTDISIMGSHTSDNVTNSLGYILNLSELKIGAEHRITQQWDTDHSTTVYTNASLNGWSIMALYMFYYTGTYNSPEACYGYGQGVPCPA